MLKNIINEIRKIVGGWFGRLERLVIPPAYFYPINIYIQDNNGILHKIWKLVVGGEGDVSVWSYTWYGRHIVGDDCKLVCEDEKRAV